MYLICYNYYCCYEYYMNRAKTKIINILMLIINFATWKTKHFIKVKSCGLK